MTVENAKRILIDTNFLLIPGQFGVDIFSEFERVCSFSYDLAVLDASVAELERLAVDSATSLKDRRAAKMALQLIKAKGVAVVKSDRKVFKSTDKAIQDFASASNKGVIVATQDRELKRQLKLKGVRVAVLRQKRYVMLY